MRRGRRPLAGLTAAERLARVLYTSIGPTAVVFCLLSLGSFLSQVWAPRPLPAILIWALVFGLPVALGVLSRRASLRLLRRIALAEGVVFLAILVFWLSFRATPLPAGADIPWALTFTGVPVLAVGVATRDRVGWAYLVVVCALSGLVRAATSTDPRPVLVGLEDAVYSMLLVGVFLGLMMAARRNAVRVDAATVATRADIAAAAAGVARSRERVAIDALVHDSVISTLLMAGRGGIPAAALAEHAATTLVRLDAVRDRAPGQLVPGPELTRRLEALAAQITPDAVVNSDLDDRSVVTAAAATALLGAVGEALRNSRVAAGVGLDRPVQRSVTARMQGPGLRITVRDDGVGFDPAGVPAERLGIARSIVERMRRVAGGAATVWSRPGAGAEVVVSWTPEATTLAMPVAPGTPATPAAIPLLVTLPRSLALVLLTVFAAVHLLLAFGDPGPAAGRPLTALGLLLIVAAAAWLLVIVPDPIPRRAPVVVILLATAGAALASAVVAPASAQPFAHWAFGAVTLLLVLLATRGRPGPAWAGYGLLVAVGLGWALLNGLGVADGLTLVVRHAATLLAGAVFAVGLTRSTRTLAVLNRERAVSIATTASAEAGVTERESELARVNALARPALERLAGGEDLDPPLRAECLIVEATLRDAIRARTLFVEPVITAARAARLRGVDVTLLDDSGGRPPEVLAAVAGIVAGQLDLLDAGRLTARLLPPGRDDVASLVVESTGTRMLTVSPVGKLRTP
ncbi:MULTISPECIES: hypothetical protein [unclassified Cryobacterium]|uniref:hypothetical protein n=1 Tax=unclassified Cryobacterium TaxID=2649013 RepID=UPI002AB3BB16|nr:MULTISPECIES: hypothetical protein [unclassified Cryobacterium]MDY7529135.1 hypothetical protein [Cryobacterium sp. 10C2]MEB0201909.1 hypothetical protein [Cryobacterium sp. 5I3]MEB0291775.1 hypothetical protein [Cryobacterium sp. 10C2]